MSPSFHVFARELVRRKVRKALAIYLGAALPAMGIANLLEARYATPQIWFDRFLILLFFGLILTGAVAWFRGKAGPQELRRGELVLYAVILSAAVHDPEDGVVERHRAGSTPALPVCPKQ